MSAGRIPSPSPVTLDQLIALNQEIAALVRAGVPLGEGLQAMTDESPGRVSNLAWTIGSRLRAGEPLSQIMASDERQFAPAWRAVVEAGMRSGNLAAALEELATSARRTRDMRRAIGMRCIYPVVVIVLAYVLFVAALVVLAPQQLRIAEDLTGQTDPVLRMLATWGDTAHWWALPLAAVVALAVTVWYRQWNRVAVAPRRSVWRRSTSYQPAILATFADLLALLIRHEVPLPEALQLAADTTGDRTLRRAAQAAVQRLQNGQASTDGTLAHEPPLPPVLNWLILTRNSPHLADSLARMAERYRYRVRRHAERMVVLAPLLFTVFVAGTATFIEALAILGPLIRMFYSLSNHS